MKKIILAIVLVLLAGCLVPEPGEMPVQNVTGPQQQAEPEKSPGFSVPVPYSRVLQNKVTDGILWGFDEKARLVLFNSSEKTVVFSYDEKGRLAEISSPGKKISCKTILYNEFGPAEIKKGSKTPAKFRYNSKGQLIGWTQGIDEYSFTFDSKERLSSYSKNSGIMTLFVYDEKNRTEKIIRGPNEINVFYDRDGRLTRFDREDDHWVFTYWRENLLSGMSGTMYGVGETISYGPETITVVSNTRPAEFRSATFKPRLNALNIYLFCTRIRKLPVMFDWASWVVFREYFGGGLADYIMWTRYCGEIQ